MLVTSCSRGSLEAETKVDALRNYRYMIDVCEYVLVEIYDTEQERYIPIETLEDDVQMELAVIYGQMSEALHEEKLM